MPVLPTPPRSTYRVGEVVTVALADNGVAANEGDTLELYLSDAGTYSAVIATQLADASGNATFSNVTVPSFALGTPRYFVVRHAVTLAEDFSDPPFELLAAAKPQQRLSLGLGLGL